MTDSQKKNVEIPQAISDEVNLLHEENHLFGSRYMATFFGYENKITSDTDWDFAFPYEGSERNEIKKAESLGWKSKPSEKYKDSLHFITWEKVILGHKVQMCSKMNLRLFLKTFYNLHPNFYWDFLHKSSPQCLPKTTQSRIFNELYRARKEEVRLETPKNEMYMPYFIDEDDAEAFIRTVEIAKHYEKYKDFL